MKMNDPPPDADGLRGTLELSYVVHRGQEAIRRALREGRFTASKVGTAHVFDRVQWEAALAYYRALDARQEGRSGADRPS